MVIALRQIRPAFVLVAALGAFTPLPGCMPEEAPTTVLLRDGDHELEWGRYDTAAEFYGRILEREPGNPDALEGYGRCMLELGEIEKAVEAFTGAVARRPGDRTLLILLAEASFETGQIDEAFDLVRTWAIDNTDAKAWLVLADFAVRSNDPDTARDALLRAIEIDPAGGPEAYVASAELERSLGDNTEALRRLRQAYGLAPDDPSIADRLRAYGEVPGPTLVLPPGP
jgi:tetratricopeptide (TPR) repeat protein